MLASLFAGADEKKGNEAEMELVKLMEWNAEAQRSVSS